MSGELGAGLAGRQPAHAALKAGLHTNPEIASQLFISPRTVAFRPALASEDGSPGLALSGAVVT